VFYKGNVLFSVPHAVVQLLEDKKMLAKLLEMAARSGKAQVVGQFKANGSS